MEAERSLQGAIGRKPLDQLTKSEIGSLARRLLHALDAAGAPKEAVDHLEDFLFVMHSELPEDLTQVQAEYDKESRAIVGISLEAPLLQPVRRVRRAYRRLLRAGAHAH